MLDTAAKISAHKVPEGGLGVFFMGQAGVILKSPSGALAAVDLYLSDCCERHFGFKRLMPKLIAADELEFDLVIATHAHYDHFDIDSMAALTAPKKTRLFAAADCVKEIDRLAIPRAKVTLLEKGSSREAAGFSVTAVDCDHGSLAPDAVGLYITCGEKRVYIAGDTCFRPDIAKAMGRLPIDLAFAPINGAFGNMNSAEAADFFALAAPKLCVPCHYWNFAEHGGDPGKFIEVMKRKYPDLPYRLMAPGECADI